MIKSVQLDSQSKNNFRLLKKNYGSPVNYQVIDLIIKIRNNNIFNWTWSGYSFVFTLLHLHSLLYMAVILK